MAHYVAYLTNNGHSVAVPVSKSFACTKSELNTELQRTARQQSGLAIGILTGHGWYETRETAKIVADSHNTQH